MAKPSKDQGDVRSEYDLDVDRMMNEGLAGGYVTPRYNKVQIEEAHEVRKNGEPFAEAEITETK
ncbi:hypothetical protein J2R98_001474 [Alkalibacillus filiformis]|uniref:Uncharacterized protein n=1 Tax=Alkalibacillus filiformis TaxID=200990 RepID=A0ABU0DTB1_9BACI|nr:hypothetical protein [Alkalibacillus filiformis]MDQ0351657.1 hypothetical protein [Alkalibacillus filiformis]